MPDASRSSADSVALAVVAILLAVLALSLGDAVIKAISVGFPLWQVYVLRSLLALPALLAAFRLRRARPPVSLAWTTLRSLLLCVMWIAYYASLPHIPLAAAAAAYYTSPLFITLFAGLFARERVGPLGWFAVLLGFAGVLVVLRPDAEAFSAYGLLPVLAAVLYALAMVLTRTKCRSEDPVTLSVALNLAFVAVGAAGSLAVEAVEPQAVLGLDDPFLFGGWVALGATEWAALALLAGAIVVGSLGAAVAYQAAPASLVATFDYAYLVFAALWALLLLGERPGAATLLGMAMIAGAGMLAVRRRRPSAGLA